MTKARETLIEELQEIACALLVQAHRLPELSEEQRDLFEQAVHLMSCIESLTKGSN